jgi:NAD(P)-dependent dehydrogenase (short-subunit alcohol dehydrogenase family)
VEPQIDEAASAALITGAAGGIGRELVHAFREAGYAVVATDLAVQPPGLTCSCYVQSDLQRFAEDDAYASDIVVRIRRCFQGRALAAVVNNAAIQILGGADSLTRADWRQTLDVNVVAPFLLTQAFLPELEAAAGCVVNIGSIHARLTKRNFVAYATSKAAIGGMTRALAVDLGPRVRVNAIEPAAIETDMLKAGFVGKKSLYEELERCHPQKRIGQPGEVARLTLAIVGGGMDFLHGACVGLDGGISSRLFDPD